MLSTTTNVCVTYGTNWQGQNLDSASRDYLSVLQTVQRYGFNDDDVARRHRGVRHLAPVPT